LGPAAVDAGSLAFVKERRTDRRALFAVTYKDADGLRHFDVIGAVRNDDGSWGQAGAAGGVGEPQRQHPWANLGGWWSNELFCAGGRVIGDGAEQAARVRLTFSDGTTLDDEVEAHVVLFLVEHGVEQPARADIHGRDGEVLASGPAF
jgi:hypothetical protein